jgi:hypothetical protein
MLTVPFLFGCLRRTPDTYHSAGTRRGAVTSNFHPQRDNLATTADPVLLLRTPSETVPFGVGDRLRLLGLRREEDEEVALPVAVLTSASEVFSLTGAD